MNGEKITNIVAGDRVTFVQTITGRLFGCGDFRSGQLASGFYGNVIYPLISSSLSEIVIPGRKVFTIGVASAAGALLTDGCTYNVTTNLTKSYSLPCAGLPQLYDSINYTLTPISMSAFANNEFVVDVKKGNDFTVALSNMGKLYAWGTNTGSKFTHDVFTL